MKYYILMALAVFGLVSTAHSASIYPSNQGLDLKVIPPYYHRGTQLRYTLTGSKVSQVSNLRQSWFYAISSSAPTWWPTLNTSPTYSASGASIGKFIRVKIEFRLNGKNYTMFSSPSTHSKFVDTDNDGTMDKDIGPALTQTGTAKTLSLNFDENSTATVRDFNDFYTQADYDRDGDSMTYSLSGTDANDFSIDAQGRLTFKQAPDYESGKTQYTLKVTAENYSSILSQNLSDSVTVTININNLNDNPTTGTVAVTPVGPVAAGRTLTVVANIQDADGPAVITPTIQWQRKSGGAWSNIANAHNNTYRTTLDDEGKQVRAQAIYTDGSNTQISKASNAVRITTAAGPQIVGKSLSVPENSVAVFYNVNDSNTSTDNDQDGNAITYALEGTDAASFIIGTSTGHLRFKVGADYESKSQYSFVVAATSGLKTRKASFTVSVTNLNDNTPQGGVSITPAGPVGRNVVLTASHTIRDADGIASPVVFKWQRLVSGNWVDIAGQTASNYSTQLADQGKTLRVQASYTDGAGAAEKLYSNQVNVTADNAPVLDNKTLSVAENQAFSYDFNDKNTGVDNDVDGDAITYSLSGADSSAFNLNANTGVLSLKQPADYEVKNSYRVTITARANAKSATATLILNVINVNEAYTGGVSILPQGAVTAGSTLSASHNLSDLDGPSPLVVTYQWQRQEAGVWQNISAATSSNYQTQDADVNKQLQVVASFTDNFGDRVSVTSAASVTVNPVASAPVAPAPAATGSKSTIKTGIQGVGSMHLWLLSLLALLGLARRFK